MKFSSPLIRMPRLRSALLIALTGAVGLAQAAPGDTELLSVAPDGKAAGFTHPASISPDGRYVVINSGNPVFLPGASNPVSNMILRDRQTGMMELVSLSSTGMYDTIGSEPGAPVSADGRYVAFNSWDVMVPGDTNENWDIFVRDRQTGTTRRVSVSSAGAQGNGDSYLPVMSADGRYVAFMSQSSNLVAGDTNGMADIFSRDLQTATTQRVSVSSTGVQSDGNSGHLAISANGRYVAFESRASNLDSSDTNQGVSDIYVRDLQTGTTQVVSEVQLYANSDRPSISNDGRYIAFVQAGSIWVRDRQAASPELVSVDSAGTPANDGSNFSSISGDGRYVAFDSYATNLVPDDTNNAQDSFVHDRQSGVTQRISLTSDGDQGYIGSGAPRLSSDGRFVAFESADRLVANDQNDAYDAYIHEIGPPVVAPFTLAPSAADFGKQAWGASSPARTIQVTNTGSANLSIQSIALTGQNYLKFAMTSHCGASLAVGATCQIDVVFKPTSVGVKTAALNVQTSAGMKSTRLTGEGVSTSFTVSLTSINFGSQAIGSVSNRRYVTVTNLSQAPLPIRAIAIGGTNPGQFGFNRTCGSTVPVGANCTIGVVFKPTSVGTKTAVITVKVAGGAKDKTVSLSGQGS